MSLSKLFTIFSILEDPLSTRSRLHSLSDVLTMIMCAAMAGVSSHDTMERDLEALSPKHFQSCLLKLVKIFQDSKQENSLCRSNGY